MIESRKSREFGPGPPSVSREEDGNFRIVALWVTCGMWAFQNFLMFLRNLVGELPQPLDLLLSRAQWTVLGIAICGGIFIVLRRLQRQPFWVHVVVTHILVIGAGSAYVGARAFLFAEEELPTAVKIDLATYWLWFFLAWAWTMLALNYRMRVSREERMRLQAQSLAHQAQLESLRYQLNPHFLFNVLNSVSSLIIDKRLSEAELMIRRLSEFLRAGLSADPLRETTLAEELLHQKTYLDIETVRFPDRISLVVHVPEQLTRALVPSLILQPLVENSVKYAVARSSELVTITIRAREQDGRLVLSVTDDGQPDGNAGEGLGVGLENVRRRLNARYGEQAHVELGADAVQGFQTRLCLPLRLASS